MPKDDASTRRDELESRLFSVVQEAVLAEVAIEGARGPRAALDAVRPFRDAVERALDGVGLVDGLADRIGGVVLQDWQSRLKAALLKIRGAYVRYGHKLFQEHKGELWQRLRAIEEHGAQLQSLHIPQSTVRVRERAKAGKDDGRSLTRKAKRDMVIAFIKDECGGKWTGTYPGLKAAILQHTQLRLSAATLVRYLKGTGLKAIPDSSHIPRRHRTGGSEPLDSWNMPDE